MRRKGVLATPCGRVYFQSASTAFRNQTMTTKQNVVKHTPEPQGGNIKTRLERELSCFYKEHVRPDLPVFKPPRGLCDIPGQMKGCRGEFT